MWRNILLPEPVNPKATIGICARNAEKIIGDAIESALNQDFSHNLMEIILIDDGSVDNTLKVMKRFAARADICTRVFTGEWEGIGAARNKVIKNARGEYIIWLDSDQIFEKAFVRKQLSAIERNPNAGIVTGKVGIKNSYNPFLVLELIPEIVEYQLRDWATSSQLPGTCGALFRTAAAREVGGFNQGLTGAGEDIDMARRMRKAGWLIVKGAAVFYETHGNVSNWPEIWRRYIYLGHHSRKLYSRNPQFSSLYRMNPISSFIIALQYALRGYRLTKNRLSFLLPFFFSLKMVAWLHGFTKR